MKYSHNKGNKMDDKMDDKTGFTIMEKIDDFRKEQNINNEKSENRIMKKLDDFQADAGKAIEEVKEDIKGVKEDIKGINIKVDKEGTKNSLQDKDIDEIKRDINGIGKKTEELSRTIQQEKIANADKKVKLNIIWAVFASAGGVLLTALIGALIYAANIKTP